MGGGRLAWEARIPGSAEIQDSWVGARKGGTRASHGSPRGCPVHPPREHPRVVWGLALAVFTQLPGDSETQCAEPGLV